MPSKKNLKNLKAISAYFTPKELQALDNLAQFWGTSRNGAIKEAIKAAIKTNWQKRDTFADYKAKNATEKDEEPAENEEPASRKDLERAIKKAFPKDERQEEPAKAKAGAVRSAEKPSQKEKPDELERLKAEKKALRNAWIDFEIDEIDYLTRAEELDRKIEAAENGKTSQETPTEKPKAKKANKAKEAERKAKAEAKREKEETEKAAAKENARIDQAIEKAKARAEAGEITPDELKAEIERLNDERPF